MQFGIPGAIHLADPPAPGGARISYGPRRVPAERVINPFGDRKRSLYVVLADYVPERATVSRAGWRPRYIAGTEFVHDVLRLQVRASTNSLWSIHPVAGTTPSSPSFLSKT